MDRLRLILTIAVAPLLLFPGRLPWTGLALVVPLAYLVRWRIRGRLLPQTPLNFPLSVLSLLLLGSVFWTPGLESGIPKIAGTVLGFFIFFSGVDFLSSRARLRIATLGFVTAGTALALASLTFTEWKGRYEILRDIGLNVFPTRLTVGSFEGGFNANPLGGTLLLFLPLAGMLWLSGRRGARVVPLISVHSGRRLALACSLAIGAVLVLSQSRGAWIGAAASFLVLVGALKFSVVHPRAWRTAIIVLLVLSLFAGVTLAMLVGANPGVSALLGEEPTREEIWARATWAIEDYPLSGMGLNVFRTRAQVLYPFFLTRPSTDIASAHNIMLQTALDLGLPALVAYASVWVILFLLLFQVIHHSSNQSDRYLAMGLGAGLGAYFIFQFADAVPLGAKLGVFWWMAAAIIVGLHRITFRSCLDEAPPCALWQPAALWATGSIVALGLAPYCAEAAVLTALGASFLTGRACLPPRPLMGAEPDSENEPLWPAGRLPGPQALGLVCVLLCLPWLPGLGNTLERNRLALRSLRDPESLAADAGSKPGSQTADELRLIGNAHWQLGDDERASKWFQASLSAGPGHPTTIFKGMLALARARQPDRASAMLRQSGFPVDLLASYSFNAHIEKNRTNSLLGARLVLTAPQPGASSLCSAKKILTDVGQLDWNRSLLLRHLRRASPGPDESVKCLLDLGMLGLENGDLPLTLKFWGPLLESIPEQYEPRLRNVGCYAAYRLTAHYSKLGESRSARYYFETAQHWCQGLTSWYARDVFSMDLERLNRENSRSGSP